MAQRIQGIQDLVAIKEKRDFEFVQIKDNFQNQWSGLKISTHYENDPIYKGVSTDNYILTMPGLPLIYRFTIISNKSGALIHNKNMHRRYTLFPQNSRKDISFKLKDTTYKVGDKSLELDIKKCLLLESSRDNHMAFYSRSNQMIFESQKEYIIFVSEKNMTIPDGEKKMFEGEFLVFTKELLKEDDLSMLDYIKFDVL